MSESTAITSCSLCRQTGHRASNCPQLSDPLILDFHKGGNGGQGHSHDDDESCESCESLQKNGIPCVDEWMS